jgi:hypothetical protein
VHVDTRKDDDPIHLLVRAFRRATDVTIRN